MSLILKLAVKLQGKYLAKQLDITATKPKETQQEFLLKLLNKNQNTVFGREHNFSQIKTEKDYRKAVPIRDYEQLRPYCDRVIKGEQSVLTTEQPFMFNVTSGTTGKPKYIPVTKQSEKLTSELMRQWLYRILLTHPQFLDFASVGIVSSAIEGYTASGIPYGSISGRIYENIPAIIRSSYAIPHQVLQLKNYEEKYIAIALFLLSRQVSFICTPNPSTLLRIAGFINTHKEELIRSIYDGKIDIKSSHQPEVISKLQKLFKPQAKRAKELEIIVEKTNNLLPKDYWKHLNLISCWIGGSVGTQAEKLSDVFGDLPIRDLGYLASEAQMTLPYLDNTSSGILAINTNYYEFIPEEDLETSNFPVLSAYELELGKRYSILLTTTGGLYRYHINDIVEVTGFYHQTPLLAFIRKGKDMTNITGEKIHVNHIILAIEKIKIHFNFPIRYYRVTPNFEKSLYEFYLELTNNISHTWLQQKFISELDKALTQVNIEYDQKRKSQRLHLPILHLMRQGWHEAECRREVDKGKREVQYKWKILCNQATREDKDAIVKTIEVKNNLF
ncbi:MAG: GH3 auxin-responsive promoter family protein [Richelia sp. RM1_1_1]|nr:GH3 auxin-responsive promoter family protein [Richelia sp. RM1_1_1]